MEAQCFHQERSRSGFPALTPHRRAGSCLTDPITIAPVHGVEPGTLHDCLRRIDRNRFATSSFVDRSESSIAEHGWAGISLILLNNFTIEGWGRVRRKISRSFPSAVA